MNTHNTLVTKYWADRLLTLCLHVEMSEELTAISVFMATYYNSSHGSINRTNNNIAKQKRLTNDNALEGKRRHFKSHIDFFI